MLKCPFNICAIIPTYNNGETIVDVVRRTYEQLPHVIVVVDGSTDDTLARLQAMEQAVDIVVLPHNTGKGGALKAGFRRAIDTGFDYAVTLDGDGQHYPEDIPLLVDKLSIHTDNTLIVGSRILKQENMPAKNTFANHFSNFWFRLQTGINLPDTQSGFRIYPLHHIGHYRWITSRYESELELLVFAAWRNVNIYAEPVRVYYPPLEKRVSHFKPAYDFTRISILNMFLCCLAIVYGYPARFWRSGYEAFWFLLCASCSKLSHGDIHHRIAHWAWKDVRKLGCNKVFFSGKPTLYDHPAVFIANHSSMYDILLILSQHPKTIVLAQEWVFSNVFFGKLAREAGYISASEGIESVLPKLAQKVNEGYSILVFPEGTRSTTGNIIRFHRGAFYLAEKLNLPIQPVLIQGIFEILSKTYFRIGKSTVNVSFLPLIMPNDTTVGTGYRERTRLLQKHYTALIRTRKSALIIGAGIGGLFTACLLAEKGYRVTVLEQSAKAGGGMQTFEKNGCLWQTGIHVVSGMEEGGPVKSLLDRWKIFAPTIRLDDDVVHGNAAQDHLGLFYGSEESRQDPHQEIIRQSFEKGAFRFVGGTQPLTDELIRFITENGGRVLLSKKVQQIHIDNKKADDVITADGQHYQADIVISSIHPKQLLKIASAPVFSPATQQRILNTPDTFGSFKIYLQLKPDSFHQLKSNHFIEPDHILFFTPAAVNQSDFAETLEIIAPLEYHQLSAWHEQRNGKYTLWKEQYAQQLISKICAYFPELNNAILSSFTSTSLTYRDYFCSPEGAMYGMSQPVQSTHTRIPNLFLSCQNCFVHGFCGTVQTAIQLASQL